MLLALPILFAITCALAESDTVGTAFPPPDGAQLVSAGPFGRWLAALTLRPADVPVRTYDGRAVGHRARVIDLPRVPGDLQQCADSALRLRATWLRSTGVAPVFHATSGDPVPFARWQAGEQPVERAGRLEWVAGGDRSFEGWLARLFVWAGTASLARYDTVPADLPRPGDVVVQAGHPGHAVVLLGVATRGEETFVLVGEGFMPAQDFHVELGPEQGWWRWDDGLALPSWTFDATHLRRWR